MRVLIYTNEFPPFAAGAGVFSADLAVGLSTLGVEVHVATPFGGAVKDWLSVNETSLLQIHYMPQWKMHEPKAALFFLMLLCLRYSFDFIIVTERSAQENVATQFQPFLPYVAVVHGTEILDYFVTKKNNLKITRDSMALFYSCAHICIANSNATKKLMEYSFQDRKANIKTIHCGLSLNRLLAPTEESVLSIKREYGADTELVLCVGRLDLDKGHDTLLHAFKVVHAQRPKARLLIGGVGPFKEKLIALQKSLGLDSVAHFLDEIPPSLLPAYYASCDVFAMPSRSESRWEGLGLVYLEANYYERPVVGGNEGGVPEAILHGETGLVVNPRDQQAVADAILFLLDNPSLRATMGKRGKQRVLEYFNSERMARETLAALDGNFKKKAFAYLPQKLFSVAAIFMGYLKVLTLRIVQYLWRKSFLRIVKTLKI